jgi:hypothetical protein
MIKMKKECKLIQRPANSRLAQWRVTLLVVLIPRRVSRLGDSAEQRG